MQKQVPDGLEPKGTALFFKRTAPRDDSGELDSAPPPLGDGDRLAPTDQAGAPALDELAQRVATMAQDAAGRYAAWARCEADALVAAAREQATAEAAQAGQKAAAILADAQETARGFMREAGEAREAAGEVLAETKATAEALLRAAEAVLAESQAKAQAMLRAAELEAEQTRQQSLLAATQEATAMVEAKRAEAAAIIGGSAAPVDAEGQSIRYAVLGAAEAEAQRLREAAARLGEETRERALAAVRQLRLAAQAIEQHVIAQNTAVSAEGNPDPVGRATAPDASPWRAAEWPEPAELSGTMLRPPRAAEAAQDVAAVPVIVSPVRGFEQLFALDEAIQAIRGVIGVEVIDVDGLTARLQVIVGDAGLFAAGLGELPSLQSVSGDGRSLIRLTLRE